MSSTKDNPPHNDDDDYEQANKPRLTREVQGINGSRHLIHIPFRDTPNIEFCVSKNIHDDGSVNFDARIPQGSLKPGYYSIVWCVNPRHDGEVLFDKLIFEVEVASTKHKQWANISREEIESIDTSASLRLRLQQKLHLIYESKVFVRLSARIHQPLTNARTQTGQDLTFQVHYVELMRLESEIQEAREEHVVKSPGPMVQQLGMDMFSPVAQIVATDVSASREHIAILAAEQDNAYVGVWKMDTNPQLSSSGAADQNGSHPHLISETDPIASATIPLTKGQFDIMQHVKIAISSDGSLIAVYQMPCDDSLAPRGPVLGSFGFNFQLFRVPGSKDKCVIPLDYQKPPRIPSLEWINNITPYSSKDQFIGFGKFMASDKFRSSEGGKSGSNGDYFVAVDESRIAVYDVDNSFQLLYGIAIGELSSMKFRVRQLQMLHKSIEGTAFVWMEDPQNVSVWDLVSGTNRKYISVNNPESQHQSEIDHLTVSPGGKLMAIAGKDWIRTYFMDSGIEICNTTIHDGEILNIEFLDEDQSLVVALSKPSMEQMSVIMDAMDLSSWHRSPRIHPYSLHATQHVVQPSEKIMKTHHLGGVMMTVNWNVLDMFAIPRSDVSNSPRQLIDCTNDCTVKRHQELSKHRYVSSDSNIRYQLDVGFENPETGSRQQNPICVRLYSIDDQEMRQHITTIIPEPWRLFEMDESNIEVYVKASFLDPWPQFIITTPSGFQVWNLPDISSDHRCELALSWVKPHVNHAMANNRIHNYAETIREVRVCTHGEIVMATWFEVRTGSNVSEYIRIPKSNWCTAAETLHCINSIPVLAECYTESSTTAKEAIVQYIVKHINRDPPRGTIDDSVMTKIARSAKLRCYSDILGAILRSADGKWIPRCTSNDGRRRCKGDTINPISILVKEIKRIPQCLRMAEQMIDYCIQEAKSQCDPSYVVPVMPCLRALALHHHDIAIDITRRMAFIPVRNQNFVVDRSILARPVRHFLWDMMRRKQSAIYEYSEPVFQLKSQLPKIMERDFSAYVHISKRAVADSMNRSIRSQVYVVPCSLLWHYNEDSAMVRSNMDLSGTRNYTRTLAAVISSILNPWGGLSVQANFTDLDYFDNPAVEAVVLYKWNSVAWRVWALKHMFYLVHYAFIAVLAVLQILPIMKMSDLQVLPYTIIVTSVFFLHLEFRQFLRNPWLYFSSVYSIANLGMAGLPLFGSVQLLASIALYENTDVLGFSWGLSAAVAGIYGHLGLELRVFKNICSLSTVATRINHDCISIDENGNTVSGPWFCPTRDTDVPRNLWGTLVAMFFMMVGRLESLEKNFQSDDMGFHIVMASYFILMFVIFMNLMIAFMNNTISKALYYGPLDWLSNRFQSATTAEALSIVAGGYREMVDLFPQYVYYVVPPDRYEFTNRFPFEKSDYSMTVDASCPTTAMPARRSNPPPSPPSSRRPFIPHTRRRQRDSVESASTNGTLLEQEDMSRPQPGPWETEWRICASPPLRNPSGSEKDGRVRQRNDRVALKSERYDQHHRGGHSHDDTRAGDEDGTLLGHGHNAMEARQRKIEEKTARLQETVERQEQKLDQITDMVGQILQQLQQLQQRPLHR
ncbi:MAG: hypothetical protein J3Q66DRAFT_437476 [Benniella sp.]|nr:MAG: hypothetical protein J3Q66DRAFT_437476 [Benniella sp.]